MLILNVLYVIIAIAMVVLILMQRGQGASAGTGFGGGGASGTVFGSRGSSNFLSKSTKWLAIAFFGISLFMAWQVKHSTSVATGSPTATDLGVMGQGQGAATPAVPTSSSNTPATAPAAGTPAATGSTPAQAAPASNDAAVPAANESSQTGDAVKK